MDKFTAAENLAFYLLEKTGSIFGEWEGKLPAQVQRSLFGRFLGKGTIVINGATETLGHRVKVCFGLDYEYTFNKAWKDL